MYKNLEDAIYVFFPPHLSIERYDEFGVYLRIIIFHIYHLILLLHLGTWAGPASYSFALCLISGLLFLEVKYERFILQNYLTGNGLAGTLTEKTGFMKSIILSWEIH